MAEPGNQDLVRWDGGVNSCWAVALCLLVAEVVLRFLSVSSGMRTSRMFAEFAESPNSSR